MSGKKILVVEDEKKLGQALRAQLEDSGFEVSLARSCAEAAIEMRRSPDIILLDWRLPDGEGVDLLKAWRKSGLEMPVILLTARSEVIDKVLALELGANDYITKPFEPRELLARVRVQSRALASIAGDAQQGQKISSSGIELDFLSYRVTFNDRPVELAKMEFELLRLFLEHPDQALSRREIMNKVWGTGNFQTTRTIDNHVSALRQKLEPTLFEAVRGVGYRFSVKK